MSGLSSVHSCFDSGNILETVGRIVFILHVKTPTLRGCICVFWNFITADMIKDIFDHIPQFSLSKKNAALDQNLS